MPTRVTDSFVTDPSRVRGGRAGWGGALKIGKEVNKKEEGSGGSGAEGNFFFSPRSESDGERCVWDETASVFPVYLPRV